MSLPDSQIGLLQTAASALHDWQDVAQTAGIVLNQVVMEFPPNGQANSVQFTWIADVLDAEGVVLEAGHFSIATLS